jgi:hypothetical protein
MHLAEIKDGKVLRVIVCNDINWAKETLGGEWIETSYTGEIRKNYAGINFEYDKTRDAFIPPKPYKSWVLDEETCRYKAPKEMPEDKKLYTWNEEKTEWVENELRNSI